MFDVYMKRYVKYIPSNRYMYVETKLLGIPQPPPANYHPNSRTQLNKRITIVRN